VNVAAYLILAALIYSTFQPRQAFAFYNDSDVIEIENDAPPVPPEGGGSTGDSSGTGSGAGLGGVVDGNDGSGSQSQGSSNNGDSQSGGTTGGGGLGSDGGSGGSGNSQSDEDLVDALIGEGIISGSGAVSGSSLFEDSLVGGSGGVTVDGDGVRRYFRGKYDLQELLLGWRAGTEARLSARGLGYIAASTALRDRNVDAVSFTADRFDIKYRSRGYLFSIIPITFPVRVIVIPDAAERVTVQLPWYRFFVREFFTARGLADDVDAVVRAEIEKNPAEGADLKAALFLAVADYLRTKVGTVSDTVQTVQ
jgi:hypothetical protein